MSEWQVYPALLEWPEAVTDIASVSPTVDKLRLTSGAISFQHLPQIPTLRDLWCFDIDAERLARICSCSNIRRLFIDGLQVADLSCLAGMNSLKVLSLERCSIVKDLGEIGRCGKLKGLGIINFKNVHSIRAISGLIRLKHLVVAGGMWTRMNIDSLNALSGLVNLEDLDLSNTKVRDESLQPLWDLKNLRSLNLPNFFPMEEFAWLSGKLKETKCTWFTPFIEFPYGVCKKCGKYTMVMLSGKRKPTLCTLCDKARLEKHVEDFRRIASQSN
jgi:hypothetical protein